LEETTVLLWDLFQGKKTSADIRRLISVAYYHLVLLRHAPILALFGWTPTPISTHRKLLGLVTSTVMFQQLIVLIYHRI